MDFLSSLNWGDVPSWLALIVTIAVPVIAYIERNRIAGFFRRKSAEPLPALPPARWVLSKTAADRLFVLANNSSSTQFNVSVSAEDVDNTVLSAGFWPTFNALSYGTVMIQQSGLYPEFHTFGIEWQDSRGEAHSESVMVKTVREANEMLQEHKTMPLGLRFAPDEAESEQP